MVNGKTRRKISKGKKPREIIYNKLQEMKKKNHRKSFSLGEIKKTLKYRQTNKLKAHLEELQRKNKVKRFFNKERLRTEYKATKP